MPKQKNIRHQLEISCAILKTNVNALADKWGVSRTWVLRVAEGWGKSKDIRSKILATIDRAQETVPYTYPDEVTSEVTKQSTKNTTSKAV